MNAEIVVVLRMSVLSHILITQFLSVIPFCKYEDVSHECRIWTNQSDRIMWNLGDKENFI